MKKIVIIFFISLIKLSCQLNLTKEKTLYLKCKYLGYTDVESENLFKVIATNDTNFHIDEEVEIIFPNSNTDTTFYNKIGDCSICYKITFYGKQLKGKKNVKSLYVDSFYLVKDKKCCEN